MYRNNKFENKEKVKTQEEKIREDALEKVKEICQKYNLEGNIQLIRELSNLLYVSIINAKNIAYTNFKIEQGRKIFIQLEEERTNVLSLLKKDKKQNNLKGNSIEDKISIDKSNDSKDDIISLDKSKESKDDIMDLDRSKDSIDDIKDLDKLKSKIVEKDIDKNEKKVDNQSKNKSNKNNLKGENDLLIGVPKSQLSKGDTYAIIKCKELKEVKSIFNEIDNDDNVSDYIIYQNQYSNSSNDYIILIELIEVNGKIKYKDKILDIHFTKKNDYIKYIKMKGYEEIDIE